MLKNIFHLLPTSFREQYDQATPHSAAQQLNMNRSVWTDVALELNTLQNSGVLSFAPMLVILAFEALLIWTPMKLRELSVVKEDQPQSEQLNF